MSDAVTGQGGTDSTGSRSTRDRAERIAGSDAVSDYYTIGGAPAVSAVVNRFYDLILADPLLASFFSDIDMPRLKRHQVLLISQVLGGPAEYAGRELREAHAHLAIGKQHFDRVVAHLVTALQEADVPSEIIDRVGAALAGAEKDVVSEPA
ncbi:MAG TPA: group 1 truncated hemoglobin [Actinopolymorphaceae bacterium]|jgi:hemoglobin